MLPRKERERGECSTALEKGGRGFGEPMCDEKVVPSALVICLPTGRV